MNVLGVSGRDRDAAAALAVDGRIVAAAAEESLARVPRVGYRDTGGFPGSAAAACLASAGLSFAAIDAVAFVSDASTAEEERALMRRIVGDVPIHPVGAVQADAAQAATLLPDAAVLVCSTSPASITSFVPQGGELRVDQQVAGGGHLGSAAAVLAHSLGLDGSDPFSALDELGAGAEPEFLDDMACVASWTDGAGVSVDSGRLQALVLAAGGDDLTESSSLNVRVQDARKALAASFTCSVAALVAALSERVRSRARSGAVAFGGGMFANTRLNSELRRLVGGELPLAFVPEAAGRALGAVMAVSRTNGGPLPGLALGPAYSDADIKRTLDNCRLDYVYEPDWHRIVGRMSRMLAQGKVVAWFQGPMAFGPRAMGTRSVLCDPSSRYARHNMNEYLRHVALDTTLPLVFAPSASAGCLDTPVTPFSVRDQVIASEWRGKLSSGLDSRHRARVHALSASQAPELCDLLEHHYASTGVPALIEINLGAPGEPVACSPRDAVRTVYSSAIDALAIGHFILMKDYWLLRSHGH